MMRLLMLGLCVLARLWPGPTPAAAAPALPRFEPAPCPPAIATSAGISFGWLVVPERRTRPTPRQVRLAVAVVHAPAANPGAEPLLDVSGGPGLASVANADRLLAAPS